jgi:ribosomal protein L40E
VPLSLRPEEHVPMKSRRKRETFVCPHCGADVPVGSPACKECGSDDETGWSEDADVWQAGIPAGYGSEDDFDYDEFIGRELPQHATVPGGAVLRKWAWGVAIVLLSFALLRYLWLAR